MVFAYIKLLILDALARSATPQKINVDAREPRHSDFSASMSPNGADA
jgi:hypothetical protein